MKPYPRSRVTGQHVREVVANVVLEDVKDPRVEFVTVTGVEMSPDLRHAKVFFVAHGGAERCAEALAGLDSAKGRIRTALGRALRLKFTPEIHFAVDPSLDEAVRISEVIRDERAAGRIRDDDEDDRDDSRD